MIRGILLFLLCCTAQALHAQTATATLDSTRIAVGSATTLTLEVRVAQGTSVQWPVLPDSLDGLEIISRGKVDTARESGGIVYRQKSQITGFDSGMFLIPPILFRAGAAPLQTEPVPLLVQTLAVDTTKPFLPIKDILDVPGSWMDNWPYLLAGLAVIGVVLFFLLRKKSPRPARKPKLSRSASADALKALQELEKSGLAERGAMSEFFTRASDVLRRYLEGRFGVAALEEPTDDMLRDIQKQPALKLHAGVLQQFFFTADLAKFAKATPTLDEARAAIGQARAFIQAVDRGGKSSSGN